MNHASTSSEEEGSQKSAKDEEEDLPFKTLRRVSAQQSQNISYRPWVMGSREAPKVAGRQPPRVMYLDIGERVMRYSDIGTVVREQYGFDREEEEIVKELRRHRNEQQIQSGEAIGLVVMRRVLAVRRLLCVMCHMIGC